ncbi:MAG: fibronectin type III domain-containing protein [Thermodesulfovibrionales bacterium]
MRKFIASAALFGVIVMFLGCGKWGGENVPQSHTPPAPVNVTAAPGNGSVTITWTASASATSYNIYFSTQTGVTKAGTKIAGVTSPAAVPNLTNGTPYFFVVTAVSSGDESVESAQVSATPSASIQVPSVPVNVIATPGDGQATISWDASAGATSYNIYYGTTSGNLKASGLRIPGATSPWVISGLSNGVLYNFVVTAVNSNVESAESTQVSATPVF